MIRRTGLCILFSLLGYVSFGINALPAYKTFYAPDGKGGYTPYLEVYWQIDPKTVNYSLNDKGHYQAGIQTTLRIEHSGNVKDSKKYLLETTPAASIRAAHLQNIIDLNRQVVGYGKVYIELILTESAYPNKSYKYYDSLLIQRPDSAIFYSGLQLIDTAYTDTNTTSVFQKNGLMQVPLSANFLDDHRKVLHYYAELYGTKSVSTDKLPLIQDISISKKEYDYTVLKLERQDTIKQGDVIPTLGKFRADILPSGNYHLNFTLTDNAGRTLAKQTLFFQRSNINPTILKDTTADSNEVIFEEVSIFEVSKTFVAEYSAAQLKAILKMLLPVSSENERDNINSFLKRPEETYIRYFIYNFWKSRSPLEPEKGWENFVKKVKEVNKLFGSRVKPGYETERGYMYLKYGKPDQRYVVSNEEGAVPYEVWIYNAPGKQSSQGAFLFYNPGFMVVDYRLLHSTVRGELRNTNWRSQLYKNGSATGNLNSRAEQTFQYR